MSRNISETIEKMKAAIAGSSSGTRQFQKAITVGLGLVNYDLEAAAKLLFPWGEKITPLRNEIARGPGNGDTAHRWKAITAINATLLPPGVSEGNRSGVVTSTEKDMLATYAGLGLEDYVTEEARYAAMGFDDVLALASENLLKATMISEERMIFGGNSSVNLGQPGTVVVTSPGTTGGALSNGTYYVCCVALTLDGWSRAGGAANGGGGGLAGATGVVQQIIRTNADGSTDTINGGTSQPSAVQNSGAISGGTSTQTLAMTVPLVTGAVAYAWYVGTSAAHQYLAAITTINSYLLTTAVPASTFQDAQTLAATDNSNVGTYGFSGLLYQGPFGANTNSYLASQATGTAGSGTALTTDNAGGITQINTALRSFYDNYRLSPDTIWCHSQEINSIKILVVKNGGAPLIRFTSDVNNALVNVQAGAVVGAYTNPVTMEPLRIRVHPFAAPGTIMFTTKESPYAGSRVADLVKMFTRQEYYSTLWPMRSRKREYGVYVDETLAMYFPPAFGAINNIPAVTS
jgi:hypothetical protein